MCGIVGYTGPKDAVPILMEGLKRLEYRGYDSTGIAVLSNGSVHETKSMGKLARLETALLDTPLNGHVGIGHTRWATHGRPSDRNAHPHTDCGQDLAVVHNGIIENYLALKERLAGSGHKFRSETDTEIVAHLIEEYYEGNLEAAVRRALQDIRGSYAIGVVCRRDPGTIVAARKDSPLVLGLGDGENFLASDIPAFLAHTRHALYLNDGEVAVITPDAIRLSTLEGRPIERSPIEVLWDSHMAEKGGYRHFMLKEIFEQPKVVHDTLAGRAGKEGAIKLEDVAITPEALKKIKKILIVACGTAYHSGLVAKYWIEGLARMPVEVDLASEFRYRAPLVDIHTLVVAVSQSGETADTLAAVREAKRLGAVTLAVTNVVGSSITREAAHLIYTRAGLEVGVAATKTFLAQLVALYLLALYLGTARGTVKPGAAAEALDELSRLPAYIEHILNNHEPIKEWATRFAGCRDALYLGRHLQFPIALEGALKLKEISYIHAEGYAAGEMKHGPIALVDDLVPVVAIATQSPTYDKMLSNIKEVKARDATVAAIATQGDEETAKSVDLVYHVPASSPALAPFLTIIPLQLLAYYIADLKGCDVDMPRNLAKSVTVE